MWILLWNRRTPQPKANPTQEISVKSGFWAIFSTANIFSWVWIGLYRKQTARNPTHPFFPHTPYWLAGWLAWFTRSKRFGLCIFIVTTVFDGSDWPDSPGWAGYSEVCLWPRNSDGPTRLDIFVVLRNMTEMIHFILGSSTYWWGIMCISKLASWLVEIGEYQAAN